MLGYWTFDLKNPMTLHFPTSFFLDGKQIHPQVVTCDPWTGELLVNRLNEEGRAHLHHPLECLEAGNGWPSCTRQPWNWKPWPGRIWHLPAGCDIARDVIRVDPEKLRVRMPDPARPRIAAHGA